MFPRWCDLDDCPFDGKLLLLLFELPDVFRKFGFVPVLFVFE